MKISDKAKQALEWNAILDFLEAHCQTSLGKTFSKNIQPLSFEHSKLRMEEITQLKSIRRIEQQTIDFSGITNIADYMAFVAKGGVLTIEQLVEVRKFLLAQERIQQFLLINKKKYPTIGRWGDRIISLNEIRTLLQNSITEWNSINRKTYPQIEKLENEFIQLRNEIEKRLVEMMREQSLRSILQGNNFTTINGRYALPIKSESRSKIKGTVLDISASSATVYVEPENISELNNRIIEKDHEIKSEIAKILKMLSKEVAKYSKEIILNSELIGELDFLNSASILSDRLNANAPELVEEVLIDLIDVRHPQLCLLNFDATVPNSIKLSGKKRCLVISGTNAGGKTVLLKTVGLCALMAAHGLHIPASPDSRICLFNKIFVDIGDEQNLVHSLSTFTAQLVSLINMITQADSKTLILIDEIVVGTDPRQGAALARAILEHLAETGACILVTTHYSELKRFAAIDDRFINCSVSFDTETLVPTYKLVMGIPGASHAFEIAKRYGIPHTVIARAQSLLDESDLSTEALIDKLQKLDEELQNEKKRVSELKQELEKEKCELENMKNKLQLLQAKKEIEEGSTALQDIRKLREMLKKRERMLKDADAKTISTSQIELEQIENKIYDLLKSSEEKVYCENLLPFDVNIAKEETEVFVLPLKTWATIDSIDVEKKQVQVIMGNSFKARYPFDAVFLKPESAQSQKKRHIKAEFSKTDDDFIPVTIQTSYNTIDLRGKRVDEAISTMNAMLDSMVRSGIRTAIVIHGHGTGALKEAVRNELKYSSYAISFRPGEMGEGGDGVTVVLLRS